MADLPKINTYPYSNEARSMYNRLDNIDAIEDRIIYYLISMNNKNDYEKEQTGIIWKLLCYDDDYDALNQSLPTYEQVRNLISSDNAEDSQNNKRIFRSPHFEDAWLTESTLLKIYIDSIIPADRYKAVVNIGIDIITHNKCINIAAKEYETYVEDLKFFKPELSEEEREAEGDRLYKKFASYPVDYLNPDSDDNPEGIMPVMVQTKSRISTLVKAIVSLLNGAHIQGVGTLEFSTEMSRFQQAQYGLWNNKNFEGIKLVMGCWMSGVS